MQAEEAEASSLQRYLAKLSKEVQEKGYGHWVDSPDVAYEEEFQGRPTQVEVQVVEVTPEYVHLLILASNSRFGWTARKSTSVFVDREQREE